MPTSFAFLAHDLNEHPQVKEIVELGPRRVNALDHDNVTSVDYDRVGQSRTSDPVERPEPCRLSPGEWRERLLAQSLPIEVAINASLRRKVAPFAIRHVAIEVIDVHDRRVETTRDRLGQSRFTRAASAVERDNDHTIHCREPHATHGCFDKLG
jgi:hypothetical protein